MCKALSEEEISIAVGNRPSSKNPFPVKAEATATIACALPVSMTMHPVLMHVPNCPLYNKDSGQLLQVCMCPHPPGPSPNLSCDPQFPVLCGEELMLEIEFYDNQNRLFSNFSSLEIHWESSDDKLLPLPHPSVIEHRGNRGMQVICVRSCDEVM